MQINNKTTKSKKWILPIAAIVMLVTILVSGYFLWYLPSQNSNTNQSTNDNPTSDTYYSDNAAETPEPEKIPGGKAPIQYEGQTEADENPNCIDNCANFAIPEEDE